MPLLTSSGDPGTTASLPSSTNGSTSSAPNNPQSPPTSQPSKQRLQMSKLDVAHKAVTLQDNSRILDMTAEAERQQRHLHQQVAQAQAAQLIQGIMDDKTMEEEERNVLIDSPTTTNNYYPNPSSPTTAPAPPSGMSSLAKAALIGAAIFGSGGLGAAGTLLFNKQPAAQTSPATPQGSFQLKVVQ